MQKTVYLFFSLLLTFTVLAGTDSYGQGLRFTEKEVKAFAQTALEAYVKNVLTKVNVGKYGFRTVEEAGASSLGEPLPLKTIELKDLKAYRPGAGLKSLPADVTTTWYPVLVNNEVRAKLEIIERSGKLLSGGFGAANEAKRLSAVRQRIPDQLRAINVPGPGTMSIVKIPALKAMFIHFESAGGDFLVPAMYSPQRFNMKNGELYPADEVLSRLREYSKDLPDDLVG